MKKIQSAIDRYSAQIRASLNDPLMWRRIIACIMLGMAWSFQRAPDAGVVGYINRLVDFISAHEVAYVLVGCGAFILARPESSRYQLCAFPLIAYAAVSWSFLKSLPSDQQPWTEFFLCSFVAGIAFWLPARWPKDVDGDAKSIS